MQGNGVTARRVHWLVRGGGGWALWLLAPAFGATLVAGLGFWACRPLLQLTPAGLLRSAA